MTPKADVKQTWQRRTFWAFFLLFGLLMTYDGVACNRGGFDASVSVVLHTTFAQWIEVPVCVGIVVVHLCVPARRNPLYATFKAWPVLGLLSGMLCGLLIHHPYTRPFFQTWLLATVALGGLLGYLFFPVSGDGDLEKASIDAGDAKPKPAYVGRFPRRNQVLLYSPAEIQIRQARIMIEEMAAHPWLTEAGNLLGQAQDRVADFVELPKSPD